MCKQYLKQNQCILEPINVPLPLPNRKVTFIVDITRIQNNADQHIRLQYFGPQLENRHLMKKIFTKKQMIDVKLRYIERAFRKKSMFDKLPIFNLLHGKWPVNMVIEKWDPEKSCICNRCTAVEEKIQHVYCCRSTNATETHKKGNYQIAS